jgi:hypothetical protein
MSRLMAILSVVLLTAAVLTCALPPPENAVCAAEPDNPFDPVARPPDRAPARSAAEVQLRAGKEAIERALAETTKFEFVEMPLSDIAAYLQELHKINVVLDKKALEDIGVGTDTQITKSLSNVTLRSALKLLLRDLNLTWAIRDEVLMITSREQADNLLTTEVYDVADLVTCRDQKNELWEDYETLEEVITCTIAPATWDAAGGPASIRGATFGPAKVLVVSQTGEGHEQLVELLAKLRGEIRRNGGAQQPPRRDRPEMPRGMGMGGMGGMGGFPGNTDPTPKAPPQAPDEPAPPAKSNDPFK